MECIIWNLAKISNKIGAWFAQKILFQLETNNKLKNKQFHTIYMKLKYIERKKKGNTNVIIFNVNEKKNLFDKFLVNIAK